MSKKIEKTETKKAWESPYGSRYTCWSCGTKFYDLGKSPAICPGCSADQADEPALLEKRPARSRSRAEVPPVDNDVLAVEENDDDSGDDDIKEVDLGDGDDPKSKADEEEDD